MCGDSTKTANASRVLNGAVPNLMVTDPPYGVEYEPAWRVDTHGPNFHGGASSIDTITNDDRADWREAYALFPGNVAYAWAGSLRVVESALAIVASGFEIRSQIIWVKSYPQISRGHYQWKHEPCWYAVRKGATADWIGDRKQTTVFEAIPTGDPYGRSPEDKTPHPTQKPVECMARGIRNHTGNVYDPFLGSGTTLIACEQLGRMCYGMEIEPRYVDVIVERFRAFVGSDAGIYLETDAGPITYAEAVAMRRAGVDAEASPADSAAGAAIGE